MSKIRNRAIKAVEKFKKSSEKEIERLDGLQQKCKRLGAASEYPVLEQYSDRLQQKRRQLTDDLVWCEQFIDQIRNAFSEKPASGERKKPQAEDRAPKSAKTQTKKT
jgi:hypothetical protein